MAADSTSRRFLKLLRPLWIQVSATILCLVLLTGVNMVTPMLIGTVFSRVFPERNWPLLWMILGGLTLLFLFRNVLFYQSKRIAVRVGEAVCFSLRTQLFERIQQKSLIFTRTQNPGKLSSKVMNDSLKIQEFIQGVIPKFIQSSLLFAGVTVMIYVLNWQLALASTFVLPLHVLAYRYFGERIKQASRSARESVDFAAGNIVESLVGVEVVKGFGGEERESQAFKEAIASSRHSQMESLRYVALQKVWADLLVGAGMLALIGFGAWQVIGRPEEKAMLAGEFIAFFWYIRLLYPTVIELMSSAGKLAGANASIERVLDLLDEQSLAARKSGHLKPTMREEITFEKVLFSFEEEGEGSAVIKNVSFTVPDGNVCAITGPSGAGKTTMVSMLPLLIAPDQGSIRIGGHDIRSIDLAHLRESIGIVFQECFLFNTTIMENLRYARPGASVRQIIDVCKQTGADDFICQLPQGYNSVIGESGITLSRGQKQLITLTRAVIKNPEILILDEATASLDPSLESYVIPTILELMKGRTTLMITHNPRLLEHADCELALADGQVASFKHLQKTVAPPPRKPKSGAKALAMLLAGVITLGLVPQTACGGELVSRRVRLSYTDPARCIQMLQLYGIAIGQAGKPVNTKNLPTVVAQPSTQQHDILPKMGTTFKATESDPMNELLVFYDEDNPEQFSRVQTLVRRDIDLPARQIMLEAMVMEISETSIDQLGIQWTRDVSSGNIQFGDITAGLGEITGQLTVNVDDLFYDFNMRLRALIREGEAEIISRPSVLTLDNRMAYIDVSDLVPIPSSKYQGNYAVQTVDFSDKKVGIQLAIRPRINEDGEEVSLQVNAMVSAVVPDEEVEVTDPGNSDMVIASSPTISIREVKTYARIANNTPFIIGGLIAKDDTGIRDRVPVLGAIPFLGKLFRSETQNKMKREVIIVITPFVLPEPKGLQGDQQEIGRNLPKDEDKFDSIGNRLFRDAYRIREEDVYDLDFLTSNEELQRLQTLADEAASQNANLMKAYPYKNFVDGRIPGEQALVYREIYSVIRRIGLDKKVDTDQLIFFEETPDQSTGFDVVFLNDYLQDKAQEVWRENNLGEKPPEDIWKALQGHALALTFTNRRNESDPDRIMFEQVPQVRVVPCPDRQEFDRLLWELNQPDEQGRKRGTILLNTERDLQRIKQAIVLREAIDLNGTGDTMTLANFSTGRLLMLPERDEEKVDLIGGRIARLFLATDRYYDLLRQALEDDMNALRKKLGLKSDKAAPKLKPGGEAKRKPAEKPTAATR